MKLREALANFKLDAQARFDAWVNDVTGFGTGRDKSTYGTVAPSRRLSDIELSSLYHADDMAARMVDIVPQEMLREPFTVTTADKELDVALKTKLDNLSVREKLTDTIRWARLYGGGALLLGADDGRDSTLPLIPENADSLSYLYVIDRRLLWPIEYYMEPGHPKFGQPKVYSVMSVGGPASYVANVHESRLVIFRGSPTGIYERAQWGSWDLSVLQRPFEILRQFNTGWKSVELMMTDGNQAIFKMSGLREMIASNSLELLRKRLEVNELYRSVVRALVLDSEGDESFERQGVSFTDIPATLDKFMLRLSAAVQIPVTILMGQSPAGMSATGDSDFRWFYDRIRSQQTTELEPRIRRIVDVMLRTREFADAFEKPKHVEITFPPLWKLTPLEEAQRRLTIAQTDAANIQSGMLVPEEAALSRFTERGFGDEIVLTPEGRSARERVMAEDLDSMKGGQSAEDDLSEQSDLAPPPAQGDSDREGGPEAAESAAKVPTKLTLAPTDLASIVTVNEARAAQGLGPIDEGDLTLVDFRAKHSAAIARVNGRGRFRPVGDQRGRAAFLTEPRGRRSPRRPLAPQSSSCGRRCAASVSLSSARCLRCLSRGSRSSPPPTLRPGRTRRRMAALAAVMPPGSWRPCRRSWTTSSRGRARRPSRPATRPGCAPGPTPNSSSSASASTSSRRSRIFDRRSRSGAARTPTSSSRCPSARSSASRSCLRTRRACASRRCVTPSASRSALRSVRRRSSLATRSSRSTRRSPSRVTRPPASTSTSGRAPETSAFAGVLAVSTPIRNPRTGSSTASASSGRARRSRGRMADAETLARS